MADIYFDNCATTKVDQAVVEEMVRMMVENYGNPSSFHFYGAEALQALSSARHQVAQVLSAPTDHIFFTSSGTEANNLAILGAFPSEKAVAESRIVLSKGEHSSVYEPIARLRELGAEVVEIPLGEEGSPFVEDFVSAVDEKTTLVSCMTVNNETGAINPTDEIFREIRRKNPETLLHTDFVQGYGKIPFSIDKVDADFVTVSSHKIHGPKGAGALYIKDIERMNPKLFGGKQEGGFRPGTENVPAWCGFGLASRMALEKQRVNLEHVEHLKARLLKGIENCPQIQVNSPKNGIPYVVNLSLLGIQSEDALHSLGLSGIYLSSGAACERGKRSHVLKAMGLDDERIEGALRIGFSKDNTEEEIDRFLFALDTLIKERS